MKLKKCQNESCGKKFEPRQIGQRACSTACALLYVHSHPELLERIGKRSAALQRAKARKERREGRERLMNRSDWIKKAQKAFNDYIRERDKDLPCICCGSFGDGEEWLTGGKWDCGHWLGRGAYPELRFHEDNAHKQLKSCNGGSSKYAKKGRTVAAGYRDGLIKKIGLERVEWLEGPHEAKKYTVIQLQEIEATYKAKLKEISE